MDFHSIACWGRKKLYSLFSLTDPHRPTRPCPLCGRGTLPKSDKRNSFWSPKINCRIWGGLGRGFLFPHSEDFRREQCHACRGHLAGSQHF